MTIQSVTETFDQQRGSTLSDAYERTYDRVFRVVTDGTDGAETVETAVDGSGNAIPELWTIYEFPNTTSPTEGDNYALCTNIRAEQQGDSPRHWKVYCSYTTDYNLLGNDSDNPLNQPAVITTSGQSQQVFRLWDYQNNPLKNSAGDFFDPPLEMNKSLLLVTVQKNLSTDVWSPSSIPATQNAVNSASYLGFAVNSLKCQGVRANLKLEQGVLYWEAAYEFLYDPDLWIPTQVLDKGWRQKVPNPKPPPAGNVQIAITDGFGGPTVERLLKDGTPIQDPTNSSTPPQFLPFTIYSTVDFNAIGLYP